MRQHLSRFVEKDDTTRLAPRMRGKRERTSEMIASEIGREGWSRGQLEKYQGKAIFNDASPPFFSSSKLHDPYRNNSTPDAKIAISSNRRFSPSIVD